MKLGANYSDVNRIRALAAQGYSADEISQATRIAVPCVESYIPQDDKPKRKRRSKEEISADSVEE
jgi:hypothetical protein